MPFVKVILYLILSVLIASCAAPTRELSQQEMEDAFEGYVAEYKSELVAISQKSLARLKLEDSREFENKQSYDVLVLSGGGANGAFGAGFLKGWGNIESGEFVRPEFDSVTGISTGSLIAPYAYVGTDEAYDTILQFYRNPEKDLVVGRSALSFLFGHDAYYDVSKMRQLISDSVTPDLIQSLAVGSAQNRSLLIGATNLDYGLMRVWDLSLFAANLNESDAASEIASRLIASSAIPAVFPPAKINGFLYVDGGASMQVVSGLDDRDWLYQQESASNELVDFKKNPRRIRIWIVINNKLLMEPEITSPAWSAIAARSLESLVRASTLQSLQDFETYSQMINSHPGFDVQMFYVAIPQEYDIPATENMFDTEKMRDLADLGEQMGADSASWKVRAMLPGMPLPQSLQ